MRRPLISVCLPVYNGADFIESALRSIAEQDADIEIIVSDDGSTDKTVSLIEGLGLSNLTLIQSGARGGQFVNFNRALTQARGEYIQLFSHDDIARPGFLESQVRMMRENPAAGLAYASFIAIDPGGAEIGRADDDGTPILIDFPTYLHISSRHGALPPSISSVMISREVYEAVGGFDESFAVAGDLEFFNRVAERFAFVRNRSMLLEVRIHPGSVTQNKDTPVRFMREEAFILPYYRRHLGEEQFQTMMRRRVYMRGATHGRYLARMAVSGDWRRFKSAYSALGAVHNVPLCILHGLLKSPVPAGLK